MENVNGMYSIKEIYRIGRGPSSSHTMGPSNAILRIMQETPDADSYHALRFSCKNGSRAQNGLCHKAEVTDTNSAFFDTAHNFSGCIAGLHEILRRQGLMSNIYCLNPDETLSEGQLEELNRIQEKYPHLNDDAFIAEHIEEWKANVR